MPRIRMCDADREKYGGDEWVELETSELLDESTGLIEQVEETWGMTPGEFLHGLTRGSIRATRALIWLCRWKAGVREDPRLFRPKTQEYSGLRMEPTRKEMDLARSQARSQEAEAGPPANRAARRAKKAPARPTKATKTTAASKRSSTSTGSTSSAS